MEVEAAKYIGAGIAVLGLIGAGIGLGILFSNIVSSLARNPNAAPHISGFAWVGIGIVELTGLLAAVIALVILYG